MPDTKIHTLAVIEKGAKIGKNVTVEPYAVIKSGVTLEDHVVIKSHAYIDGNTRIGEGTVVYPSASIGTKPQHLKYRGEDTEILIGKHCEIREFVTINSSSEPNSAVKIGDNCLIMAYCHIAHNCELGNRVVMSNGATLAGHVVVEDFAFIGGMTPVHQFSRIGSYTMVGGLSRITHDVPPYTIGGGIPFKFGGLNIIGLKRQGFPLQTRRLLSKAFRITYRSGLRPKESLEKIINELEPIPEIKHWIEFCQASRRGLMGLQGVGREAMADDDLSEDYESDLEPILAEYQLS
jgi:UDP-N-acetylglucosamine acyltransferase